MDFINEFNGFTSRFDFLIEYRIRKFATTLKNFVRPLVL